MSDNEVVNFDDVVVSGPTPEEMKDVPNEKAGTAKPVDDDAWMEENRVGREQSTRRMALDWAAHLMEVGKVAASSLHAGDDSALETAERLVSVAAVYVRFVETGA